MTRVRASQKTAVGIATYANSITLTPGTLTITAHDGEFKVHSLTRDGALELRRGDLDLRVVRAMGDR